MSAHEDRDLKRRVRKAEEWDRADKIERDSAVKAMFQHRHSRRYIYWLLEEGNAFATQQIFTGNALTTAFNCGRQEVGKVILANLLEVDPAGVLALLKEMEDERTERQRAANPGAGGAAAVTYPDDGNDPETG